MRICSCYICKEIKKEMPLNCKECRNCIGSECLLDGEIIDSRSGDILYLGCKNKKMTERTSMAPKGRCSYRDEDINDDKLEIEGDSMIVQEEEME